MVHSGEQGNISPLMNASDCNSLLSTKPSKSKFTFAVFSTFSWRFALSNVGKNGELY